MGAEVCDRSQDRLDELGDDRIDVGQRGDVQQVFGLDATAEHAPPDPIVFELEAQPHVKVCDAPPLYGRASSPDASSGWIVPGPVRIGAQ